jgi:undecaprenyl-diphosphatase
MTLLQAIILGIIQGLTEFLPISSSAHLVLVPYLLGWHIPQEAAFVFDVLVQVASLVAVIAYFSQDLIEILRSFTNGLLNRKPFEEPPARLGWLLILATIPAGLVGLIFKNLVEKAFANPNAVAIFLLITAILLVTAEKIGQRNRGLLMLTWIDSLWIGFAQAISVFPGISRSGATIMGGMVRGLERQAAARFAFLMSIPIMLAAGIFALKDLVGIQGFAHLLPVFIPGLIVSAVVSYFSIRWLLRYLTQRSLYIFAIYCASLGLITLIIAAIH